jgi:hypothetical protein
MSLLKRRDRDAVRKIFYIVHRGKCIGGSLVSQQNVVESAGGERRMNESRCRHTCVLSGNPVFSPDPHRFEKERRHYL